MFRTSQALMSYQHPGLTLTFEDAKRLYQQRHMGHGDESSPCFSYAHDLSLSLIVQ